MNATMPANRLAQVYFVVRNAAAQSVGASVEQTMIGAMIAG